MLTTLVCVLFSATNAVAFVGYEVKLEWFENEVKAAGKSRKHSDALTLKAVANLEMRTTMADLPKLENFAIEKHKEFLIIPIFVRRSHFDSVARLATSALTQSDNRSYSMWKWWETMFGKQEDFQQYSTNLGLAFADLYEKSDEAKRVVIADIFSKKLMSAEEFRRLVTARPQDKK